MRESDVGKCHFWLVQVKNKIHSVVNGCFGNMSYQVIFTLCGSVAVRELAQIAMTLQLYIVTLSKKTAAVWKFFWLPKEQRKLCCANCTSTRGWHYQPEYKFYNKKSQPLLNNFTRTVAVTHTEKSATT